MATTPDFTDLLTTLKRAAAALKAAEIEFVLGGSVAAWARGGPGATKDFDLMVRPADAERALATLVEAGMRPEHPPEDWLVKAWDGDVLVDLIFSPSGLPVDEELMARGEVLNVLGLELPVMAIEDVLTTQLLSLGEHRLDLEKSLQIGRSVREQIDWDLLRERTAGSPYARAYLTLVEELGIAPPPGTTEGGRASPGAGVVGASGGNARGGGR